MSNRVPITRAQADFLKALKDEAERASQYFAVALNTLGLAVNHNGQVSYDLGPEPWIEVKAPEPKGD